MTLEIASTSLEDTVNLGAKVGQNLHGGETIELVSDIGGGKTAFVRGLANGIQSPDQVASPTFTVSRHYSSADGKIKIHHFDFHRLSQDPGLMERELQESLQDPQVVAVVEWAGSVENVMPDDRLVVDITPTGEQGRHFNLSCGKEHSHLLNGVAG